MIATQHPSPLPLPAHLPDTSTTGHGIHWVTVLDPPNNVTLVLMNDTTIVASATREVVLNQGVHNIIKDLRVIATEINEWVELTGDLHTALHGGQVRLAHIGTVTP